MQQTVNEKYKDLFLKRPRYFFLMGGRGAGRSHVASQYANAKIAAPEYFRCAIMRFVLGDIRNSIYREILDRAEENGIKDALDINDSTMTIRYGANSINAMGFRKSSGEQKAKLKSLANYNSIIIEEADEISEADFMQLDDSIRTLKADITIILLFNPPPRSHWIIKRWFDLLPSETKDFYIPILKPDVKNAIFIHTSYKDNEKNISKQTIANYEEYQRTKPDHFWSMVRGLVPEVVRGKIYSNWREIPELPHEARLIRRWIDFGYSNDPTAIGALYYHNGGYILDEEVYQKGLSNKKIADNIQTFREPNTLIIADSAEPKSIDELKSYGLNIQAAEKGPGSVNQGIQTVQGERISYTKRSINIKIEYDNYAWVEDKEGKNINVPKDIYNHHMDGIRYVMPTVVTQNHDEKVEEFNLYSQTEYN